MPEDMSSDEKVPVLSEVIVQKTHYFLLLFIALGLLMTVAGIYLYFGPGCNQGIGCVALLPFMVLVMPVFPAVWVSKLFLVTSSGLLESATLLKFLPILLVFLNGLVFCALLGKLFLKDKQWAYYLKYLIMNFVIAFILFSIVIFIQYPVTPFHSESSMIKYNIRSDTSQPFAPYDSTAAYLYYKVQGCNKHTAFYTYPFKRIFLHDNCLFQNFILSNPFKDVKLSQQKNFAFGEQYSGQMGNILRFFNADLQNASEGDKVRFCLSFYSVPTTYDFNISNREFCQMYVLVDSVNFPISPETCYRLLTYGPDWRDLTAQRMCKNLLDGENSSSPSRDALNESAYGLTGVASPGITYTVLNISSDKKRSQIFFQLLRQDTGEIIQDTQKVVAVEKVFLSLCGGDGASIANTWTFNSTFLPPISAPVSANAVYCDGDLDASNIYENLVVIYEYTDGGSKSMSLSEGMSFRLFENESLTVIS